MQTTEGKTPLFCAVLSGDIKPVDKMRIIKLWFDTNCIDLSLRKQSGEDLLQLAKKNKLYEFIVEYCLREDWQIRNRSNNSAPVTLYTINILFVLGFVTIYQRLLKLFILFKIVDCLRLFHKHHSIFMHNRFTTFFYSRIGTDQTIFITVFNLWTKKFILF